MLVTRLGKALLVASVVLLATGQNYNVPFNPRAAAGYDCSTAPESTVLLFFSHEATAQTGANNDYLATEYDSTNYVDASITSADLDEYGFAGADTVSWTTSSPLSDSISVEQFKNTTNGGGYRLLNSSGDMPTDGQLSFTYKYLESLAGNGTNPIFTTSSTAWSANIALWVGMFAATTINCCFDGDCVTTTTSLNINDQVRITCRWDELGANDTIEVYVDGVSEDSDTAAALNWDDTGHLVFMAQSNVSGEGVGAQMDDFVLTNSATHFNWYTHLDVNGCTDFGDW